ncbi:Protein FAM49 homolog,Protein FAM49B,Protein FAM49A [Acanthosepion pharaonis]|uniref:Protein FAM49 homolog,Protein FAM49B,Protein FAM49A n=1 Tax=Acanthosepion pharaonis TaxID=158019 RepID=A0A812E5Z0_ACAPH|nr:Protein FAM49 homolog,Protein FAM49B,Protein FAM49A [Sepia pharaonis]
MSFFFYFSVFFVSFLGVCLSHSLLTTTDIMGNLLRVLTKDDSAKNYDVYVDFENAKPTENEIDVWAKVNEVLLCSNSILVDMANYHGAAEEIRLAISFPQNEEYQEKAWSAVYPMVLKLKEFYEFSISLENVIPVLLRELCSSNLTSRQHLETQQALFKQFAEILDFVLKFDDLKMTTPAIQNDFSYYRRTVSRKRMANESLSFSLPFSSPSFSLPFSSPSFSLPFSSPLSLSLSLPLFLSPFLFPPLSLSLPPSLPFSSPLSPFLFPLSPFLFPPLSPPLSLSLPPLSLSLPPSLLSLPPLSPFSSPLSPFLFPLLSSPLFLFPFLFPPLSFLFPLSPFLFPPLSLPPLFLSPPLSSLPPFLSPPLFFFSPRI